MNIDLDMEQETVGIMVNLIWPQETPMTRAVSMSEEVGEVCRAALKRRHAELGLGDRSTDVEQWSANLRTEVAQVMINCLAFAHAEGFSLREALLEEMDRLNQRREDLGLEWSDA